ncbi:transglutaminase family protein [Hyphomicrobium sp.]|uniref:transglutaminase family protein n=1 Tax=Hyphomicrobium sp. TaxID=82 RepID=UPI002CF2AFC2|nr:transglutaminase family protein [Hyphomicrobium sp.]HRN88645.1 transglutaminase family protein [Hyphomicrobium sp.]HRQ27761.1 transglutaminase family protein [Hyphomicrobium sp.]
MAILTSLHHVTHYAYDRAIALGPQIIRLRPAAHARVRIPSYSLTITPVKHFINWQQDLYGNWLARCVFPEKTSEFRVSVDLLAEMAVINPFDFFVESFAERFPFQYPADLALDLAPYLATEALTPKLDAFLESISREAESTVEFLVALNGRIAREIRYQVRHAEGVQAPEETLSLGMGSCRDSTWLLVNVLRRLGFAARFVSGYLIQLKPDVVAIDGPQGAEADFTDLHAWAEVYLPGAGWIGFDPTSGLVCGEGHIPLAAAPHYRNASPISGTVEAAKVTFGIDMTVRRVAETPRVTLPFSDESWQALDVLGEAVDADLAAHGVGLTMGGEPTFVSLDDYQSPEWTVAAIGPGKRAKANELVRRLRDRFGPGGLLHFGQGKWYPGEPLPRWAFALYWRPDGMPLWRDASLVAREDDAARHAVEDAKALAEGVAGRLGLDARYVVPAYEDPLHAIAEEARLPADVDPNDAALADGVQRSRLAKQLDRGFGAPAGFVLPLARASEHWASTRWRVRREHLFLVPGDSPLGLRLPLSSLAAEDESDVPEVANDNLRDDEGNTPARKPPVRTAFAVELREGRLCVFMPPIDVLEDYLVLLGAVEDTVAALELTVAIEGYPPPDDHRLSNIKVTPDPGVIEINVHPASTWRDCVAITEAVYAEARQTRLGAEKFMMDGRHTGTGGGNHVVVGGATAGDSPFLRRPDLLKSLIVFWQRHPSLSYLFSGLFIGPTSQAPRVDESRHESLYELEIALGLIPPPGEGTPPAPWMVDRLLRNLMVDLTGNTHRAEICIDKLYAPQAPAGRLGLVEFRAFEMPPDHRMSLAQQLLIRALIAKFWRTPESGPLVRWGTALHDRFMLEHYVWTDFLDVLDVLRRAGYAFDDGWFEAQRAFRFPFYGAVEHGGVTLEVRQALEPWHVMGEEVSAGATSRAVDSSVERLQVKAAGFNPRRHVLACNGRRVPLASTGRSGEFVAGVRFKAWQLPSGLHPAIAPHAPLRFDVLDTWSSRSLGGCVYHVAHPGGRHYETFPVNAYEAEARRLARFDGQGHTPGIVAIPPSEPNDEYPATLDLRRAPPK